MAVEIDCPHLRNSETFERIRQTLKNKCLFSLRHDLDCLLFDIELQIQQLNEQKQLLIEIIECAAKVDRFEQLKNNYYVTDRTLRERKKRKQVKELSKEYLDDDTPKIIKGGIK